MSTLKEIRDQIKIDAGILGDKDYPDLRLNKMINLSCRYTQIQLNGLGAKKWESSVNCTLTASLFTGINVKTFNLFTAIPNLAEGKNAVRFIEISDGTRFGVAYPIEDTLFYEEISNSFLSPTIRKPKFSRMENTIVISPASVTTALAHYYKVVTDLVNDNDVSEIPIEYDDLIIKQVLITVDSIRGKLQDKNLALQELDKNIGDTFQKYAMKESEVKKDQQLQ
jgi:hypothetical protein